MTGQSPPPHPTPSGDSSRRLAHRPRLAVMLSGSGRSLENLLDHTERGAPTAHVALVIASKTCRGAEIARAANIPTVVEHGRVPAARLGALLDEHRIDLVVLAGYLHLLDVPDAYAGRVLNIHPSLLPKFGGAGMHGLHVHRAVLAAGGRETGCTVHVCDATYDTGPTVLQRRCPVLPGDTPEALAARVFEQEKLAYPEAIARVLASLEPMRSGAAS